MCIGSPIRCDTSHYQTLNGLLTRAARRSSPRPPPALVGPDRPAGCPRDSSQASGVSSVESTRVHRGHQAPGKRGRSSGAGSRSSRDRRRQPPPSRRRCFSQLRQVCFDGCYAVSRSKTGSSDDDPGHITPSTQSQGPTSDCEQKLMRDALVKRRGSIGHAADFRRAASCSTRVSGALKTSTAA